MNPTKHLHLTAPWSGSAIRVPAWVWLLLVAIPIRFINLGQESFWYDETFTAWVAKLPFDRMLQAIRGDVHPPLWYLIEWTIAHTIGDSEFSLRLPSAVFGTFAVILLWRIAAAVGFDARTAFVAGLIAAVLPGALYYSQEARMYALLLCALLGMLLSAMRSRWIVYAACSIIAIYSQNLGLVSVVAINIGVLICWLHNLNVSNTQAVARRQPENISRLYYKDIRPIMAMAITVIAWLPWATVELRQAAAMGQGFWLEQLTVPATISPLLKLTIGERAAPSIAMVSYIVVVVLMVVGLVVGRKWLKTPNGLLVLSLMIGAPATLALVSWLWRSVYLPRAMIGSVYLIALLWAYLLCHLPKLDRRTVQIITVPVLGACLIAHYQPNETTRPPWRDYVNVIKIGWQPGDVMYYGSINAAIAVGYYMQGYPYALKHTLGDLNQSLTYETQAAFGFNEGEFDALPSQGYKRAWLIVGLNPLSNASELDQIHHIMNAYPNIEVKTFVKSNLGEESIYLVSFQKGLS